MSFPALKLDWAPAGTEGQPRAHVVLSHFNEGPVACGTIPLEWLTNVYSTRGSHASIVLSACDECDHLPPAATP